MRQKQRRCSESGILKPVKLGLGYALKAETIFARIEVA
jgi:hypothetical protein